MSTPTKRVAFHTMGCKLNYSETSTISRDFITRGFEKVEYRDHADIYVINTCSVTENADKEARKLIRRAKRKNPLAKVVIIGCYAQLQPTDIAKIDGVDMVLGASEKFELLEEHQVQVQNMFSSRFLSTFEVEVNSWQKKLANYRLRFGVNA